MDDGEQGGVGGNADGEGGRRGQAERPVPGQEPHAPRRSRMSQSKDTPEADFALELR